MGELSGDKIAKALESGLLAFDDKMFCGKPFWELAKISFAMDTLAKTKQKLFIIKKPAKNITQEDLNGYVRKALSKITKRDYHKFLKLDAIKKQEEVLGYETFSDSRDGFANYLYLLLVESGFYHMQIRIVAREFADKQQRFYFFGQGTLITRKMYNDFCLGYANILYPEGEQFAKMVQGDMLNKLMQTGRSSGKVSDDTIIVTHKNVRFFFDNSSKYGNVALTPSMKGIQILIHEDIANKMDWGKEQESKKIDSNDTIALLNELDKFETEIDVNNYMAIAELSDRKRATKKIKTALERLFDTRFVAVQKGYRYEGKKKVEFQDVYEGRILQSKYRQEHGGKFYAKPSNDFLRYCATTSPADYHKGILKIDERYFKYALAFYLKMWEHYMLVRGKEKGHILSVLKLIESVDDFPTYEEVAKRGRHFDRDMITPLEKNLDELKRLGVLVSWEYCNEKEKPLTSKQLDSMDYKTWSDLYIKYVLNLPSQDKYITAHKKKIDAAKKRKEQKTTST